MELMARSLKFLHFEPRGWNRPIFISSVVIGYATGRITGTNYCGGKLKPEAHKFICVDKISRSTNYVAVK